jgi:hypothetical protein
MRGLPVSAVQKEHIVQVWFGSPTSDSSDSILLDIPCHNADQARGLADEYSKFIKGIYPVYEISETTQKVISDLQQQIQDYRTTVQSQQQLIVELKEEIGSSFWFDKTIGVS